MHILLARGLCIDYIALHPHHAFFSVCPHDVWFPAMSAGGTASLATFGGSVGLCKQNHILLGWLTGSNLASSTCYEGQQLHSEL